MKRRDIGSIDSRTCCYSIARTIFITTLHLELRVKLAKALVAYSDEFRQVYLAFGIIFINVITYEDT